MKSEDVLIQSENTSSQVKPLIPPSFATPFPSTKREIDMRKKFMSVDLALKNKKRLKHNKSTVELNNEHFKLASVNWKRIDAYGNPITKYRPKQKVTFIDLLNPNKQFFNEVYIESYKESNLAMSYPDARDVFGKRAVCCSSSSSCCII